VNSKLWACAGVVALVVAGFVSACGSSGTSAPPASTGSSAPSQGAPPASSQGSSGTSLAACSALTQSSAATITGDSTISKVTGSSTFCMYSDVTGSSGAGAMIDMEANNGISASVLQAALAAEATGGSSQYQPVSGIGDAAWSELQTAGNGAGLVFAKGGTVMIIVAESATMNGSQVLSSIEQVAKTIVGEM